MRSALPFVLALFCAHAVTACDYEYSAPVAVSGASGTLLVDGEPPYDIQDIVYDEGRIIIRAGDTWLDFFHDTTGNYELTDRGGRICRASPESYVCVPAHGMVHMNTDDDPSFAGTVELDPGQGVGGEVTFTYSVHNEERSSGGCGSMPIGLE
jgi:hypothetical protein